MFEFLVGLFQAIFRPIAIKSIEAVPFRLRECRYGATTYIFYHLSRSITWADKRRLRRLVEEDLAKRDFGCVELDEGERPRIHDQRYGTSTSGGDPVFGVLFLYPCEVARMLRHSAEEVLREGLFTPHKLPGDREVGLDADILGRLDIPEVA